MIEKAFAGASEEEAPANTAKWTLIGLANLVIAVLVVLAIILLVKLAF